MGHYLGAVARSLYAQLLQHHPHAGQGGTHEQGLRNALTKGLRTHGERTNNRKTGP